MGAHLLERLGERGDVVVAEVLREVLSDGAVMPAAGFLDRCAALVGEDDGNRAAGGGGGDARNEGGVFGAGGGAGGAGLSVRGPARRARSVPPPGEILQGGE